MRDTAVSGVSVSGGAGGGAGRSSASDGDGDGGGDVREFSGKFKPTLSFINSVTPCTDSGMYQGERESCYVLKTYFKNTHTYTDIHTRIRVYTHTHTRGARLTRKVKNKIRAVKSNATRNANAPGAV